MAYTIITSTELYHHGVVGMKWGVRRYQNKDGTRTSLGKKRLTEKAGSSDEEFKAKTEKFFTPVKVSKDKPPISPAEKVTKDVANISSNSANIARISRKAKIAKENNAKEMSDEELAKRIKRLEMEKRYTDLTESEIERGHLTVENYANIAASMATILGSAISVYAIFKNL